MTKIARPAKLIHAVLQNSLGLRVDGTCRLIEDEYRRGCDGQKLTLSLTQIGAVSGEYRVVAVGVLADKGVSVCQLCSCVDLFVGGIQLTFFGFFTGTFNL